MTDRSRLKKKQKTGNERRGNAKASQQARQNLKNTAKKIEEKITQSSAKTQGSSSYGGSNAPARRGGSNSTQTPSASTSINRRNERQTQYYGGISKGGKVKSTAERMKERTEARELQRDNIRRGNKNAAPHRMDSNVQNSLRDRLKQSQQPDIIKAAAQQQVGGYEKFIGNMTRGEATGKSGAMNRKLGGSSNTRRNDRLKPGQVVGKRPDNTETIKNIQKQRQKSADEISQRGSKNIQEGSKAIEDIKERNLAGAITYDENGNPVVDKKKKRAGDFKNWMLDLEVAGLQMGGDALVGVGTGGLGGMASMFTRAGGMAMDEAERAGASRDQAIKYGLAIGGVEALTEKIGAVASPLRKVYGKGVTDTLMEKIIGKMAAKTTAGEIGQRTFMSALTEGLEEMVAEGVEPTVANKIYADTVASTRSDEVYNDAISKGYSEEEARRFASEAYNAIHQSTSLADIFRAGSIGAAMGGILGGAGNVIEAGQGAAIKDLYGKDGIREMAKKAKDSDDDTVVARATAILDQIDNGGDVTAGQANAVFNAVQQQEAKDNETMRRYDAGIYAEMRRNGYESPLVEDEENGVVGLNRIASDKYQAVMGEAREAANEVADSEEESGAIADAIAAVMTGIASPQQVSMFTTSNPQARAVFESVTGETLPKSNAQMREKLFAMSARNFVETAREETDYLRDQINGVLNIDMTQDYGSSGQSAFADVMEDEAIDPRDNNKTVAASAFEDYYRAGALGIPMEQILQNGNPQHSTLSMEQKQAAYEAGIHDAQAQTSVPAGSAIAMGERLSMAKTGRPTGMLYVELSDETKPMFTGSQQRMYRELAKRLHINIHIVDDIVDDEGNVVGANGYHNKGEVYLSMNNDRGLELVFGHEVTHLIKASSPEAYAKLEELVRDRWEEQGGIDEAIKAKQEQYKDAVGQSLSESDALEEIIADATYEMFGDPEFVAKICAEEKTLGKTILYAIRTILANIRAALASSGGFTPSQNAQLLSQLDILSEFEDLWLQGLRDAAREGERIQSETVAESITEEDVNNSDSVNDFIRLSLREEDMSQDLVERLNGEKKVKVYRAMQYIDGRLYPPMAAVVEGNLNGGTELNKWEQSEERPDLCIWKKGGKVVEPETEGAKPYFRLWKRNSNKNGGKGDPVDARYNPYIHTSLSPLNDQFSSAYARPNMVVVEGEVPESELSSGYKAELAKDSVGETEWKSGKVAGELKKVGKPRRVILSRYFRPTRVLENDEVAQEIAKLLEGTDIKIPANVVTPGLLSALEERGVEIDRENVPKKYKEGGTARFSVREFDNNVPSEEDIKNGTATYMGFNIVYEPGMSAEAKNMLSYISVSDKFLSLDGEGKREVLAHEVAHNVAENIENRHGFANLLDMEIFGTKKIAPKGSLREGEPYYEGLFGDVGANSLDESITDAVKYYITHPDFLKRRSEEAFDFIDNEYKTYGFSADVNTEISDTEEAAQSVGVKDTNTFEIPDDPGTIRYSLSGHRNKEVKPVVTKADGVTGELFTTYDGTPVQSTVIDMTEDVMKILGKSDTDIKKVRTFMDSVADYMEGVAARYTFIGLEDVNNAGITIRRDKDGNPDSVVLSAMVKNGEYPVNFDFSSVCKKREAVTNLINDLSKLDNGEFINNVSLSQENLWKLNEILMQEGFETACLGCFVETKRYNIEAWADSFVEKWNAAVEKINPNAEYFDFGSKEDLWYTNDIIEEFKEEKKKRKKKNKGKELSNEQTIEALLDTDVNLLKKLRRVDLMSPEGIKGLQKINPSVYGVLYGHYGSGTPKPVQPFTPYNSEVALMGRGKNYTKTNNDETVRKNNAELVQSLREIGGLRTQSFSDFLIQNVFDYMQMIADMAARGFPGHAYSKEIAFAKIFGMTGLKINMSIMFDVDPDGIAPGLDKDGNYVVADKARQAREKENGREVFAFSFGWDDAIALQNDPRYDGNVGTIGVGLSDMHIRKMLKDPDIKFIIPYHKSGLPKPIAERSGLNIADNYTNTQNTTKVTSVAQTKEDKKAWKNEWRKAHPKKTAKDAEKAYKKWWEKNQPKYDKKYFTKLYKEHGSWRAAFEQFHKDSAQYIINTKKVGEGSGDFDIYTGDKGLDATQDPKATVENYFEWCVDNEYLPLFYQFADHENYYKLLYDFNVYKNDGTFAPQKAVENIYPEDLFDIIEGYMKEANEEKQKQAPKWDVVKERSQKMLMGETKYSIKETDSAYMDAVERGDMETAQRMVDEAAEKAGYTEKVYHGTDSFGFTKVDNEAPGSDGFSFWASNREDASATYTLYGKLRRLNTGELSEKELDNAIDSTQIEIDKAISEFRGLIDKTFSEWVFGQTDNSYLRSLVNEANPEPGNEDGVYDVLNEIVFEAYHDYGMDAEMDFDEWSEETKEGNALFDSINYIESLRGKIADLENNELKGGVYELFANIENFYELDAKGKAWNELTPEGLPELVGYSGYGNRPYKTRDVANWAKENGYNGVKFSNIKDNGSYGRTEPFDVYAFFNPKSQVKSADPVVYDNNGDVIPLSKRFNEENADIRFSVKESPERVRDLIAVHNLTETKLKKVLNLGGFPMPSIAVTNLNHENFGDISLLFGSETIDPRRDRNNRVYSADAWTPTVPETEYEADHNVVNRAYNTIKDLIDGEPNYMRGVSNDLHYQNVEYELKRYGGFEEFLDELADMPYIQYAYLKSQGEDIAIPQTTIEPQKDWKDSRIPLYEELLDNYGEDGILELRQVPMKELYEREDIKDLLERYIPKSKIEGRRKAAFGNALTEAVVYNHREEINTEPTVENDYNAANRNMKEMVDKDAELDWLRDLFDGVILSEGVYNGKDMFTSSGNRRSFKALHYPATVDGIVQAMKAQGEKNISMVNTVKTLRADTAKSFKSLAEIHKSKGRLKDLSEEQVDEVYNELDQKYSDILNTIFEANPNKHGDNPFFAYDSISETISECAQDGINTENGIIKKYNEYGWNVSEETANDILQLLDAIENMPVNMFEAKPRRAVGFDEVKAAILPESTSEEVKKQLSQRGIPVTEYDPSVEGDRAEKVNLAADEHGIKFSVREQPTEPTPIPNEEDAIDYTNGDDEIYQYEYDGSPYAEAGKNVRFKSYAELRAKVEKLQADKRLTHGRVLDTKPIRKDVENMLRTMASIAEQAGNPVLGLEGRMSKSNAKLVDDIVKNANHIYKMMKSGREEEAVIAAMNVADDIVERIQVIDDAQYDTYKEMKKYLRETPIAISEEDASSIPDFGTFKKNLFGKVRIVKEGGLPVDIVYEELMEIFPGVFDEEITHPADQLMAIADAREAFEPYDVMLTAEEREQLLKDTTMELLDIIAEGEPWKSWADKKSEMYQNKVKMLQERHREALRKLREEKNEKIERIQTKNREQRAERIDKKKRLKSFGSIEKNHKWLSDRLLKPSDDKHIPEGYQIAIAELLMALDLQTERSKALEEKTGRVAQKTFKFRELLDAYEEIANPEGNGILEYDDNIVSMLKDSLIKHLEGKSVDALDTKTMGEIDTLLKAIVGNIKNVNKAFAAERDQTIEEMAARVTADCNHIIDKRGTFSERKRNLKRYFLETSKVINIGMKKPREFFTHLGKGMTDAYMEIRHGEDKHFRNMQILRGKFEEIFKQYNNKKKPGSAIEKWRDTSNLQTFELENGDNIKLNPSQVMSLYCLMKREQAQGHIFGSGIVPSKVEGISGKIIHKKHEVEGSKVMVTYGDVMKIIDTLTDEQRTMADQLQSLLNNEVAAWGNETSMLLYNYRKFTEENYFPIKCHDAYLDSNFEGQTAKERIRNFGFTKGTVTKARNPIVIADIFEVVTDHCNKMSLYNAFAAPLADFTRLYNSKFYYEDGNMESSVKDMLTKAYGKDTREYIENVLADVNNNTQVRPDETRAVVNKFLANYKRATIGMNMRVAVQQPTAIVRAFDVIDPKYFVADKQVVAPWKIKRDIKEMCDHCPIAMWKSWGHNDVDMARDLDDIMMNKAWSRFDIVTMGTYGALDIWTWSKIWNAVKREVKAKNPGVEVGSDEYWDLCNERASEVFDRTQVVDSVLHRSQTMRSKDTMTKMISSFMAEPTTTFNMLQSDIAEARDLIMEGEKGKAAKKLTRCMTVFGLNAAAVSAAAAVIDLLRGKEPDDDDKDKEGFELWYANFLNNFIDNANPIKMIPYASQVFEMFTGTFGTSNMAFEGWESLGKALQEFEKFINGDSKKSEVEIMWMVGDGIGNVLGIPIKSIDKDYHALMNRLGISFASEKGSDEKVRVTGDDGTIFEFYPGENMSLTEKFFKMIGIEDNSKTDNFLNKFGINLSEEEKQEQEYQNRKDEILKKCEGLEGEEREKKLWSIITGKKDEENLGITSYIESADFDKVEEMKKLYVACGGDKATFDEKVIKKAKTAYKKTIGVDDAMDRQFETYDFLIRNGVSEAEISEIVKSSDTAREFKKAFALGDDTSAALTLSYLTDAGLSYEDYEYLCSVASRSVKASDYATGEFEWPTSGTVTSGFGRRSSPTAGASSYHQAIDIGAPTGTPVKAADGGKVIYCGWYGGYGNRVVIDHGNGYKTCYSHLSGYEVQKGQVLKKGQQLGKVGSTGVSTGPHLDFQVEQNGSYVDPQKYLQR